MPRHVTSATSSHAMSRNFMSCHVMPRQVTSCYVMSRYFTSCHVMPRHVPHVTSCHVMSRNVMSRNVRSCHVMSCHIMSHLAPSCHVMTRNVTSCHVMLRHIMSKVAGRSHDQRFIINWLFPHAICGKLLLKRSSRFQRLFPNPSWLVWGRASRHQKLAPTFPGIDSCLMVTKWDFLEMEASLWLNGRSQNVAKGWLST